MKNNLCVHVPVADPALSRNWTRWPPEFPSNLNSVILSRSQRVQHFSEWQLVFQRFVQWYRLSHYHTGNLCYSKQGVRHILQRFCKLTFFFSRVNIEWSQEIKTWRKHQSRGWTWTAFQFILTHDVYILGNKQSRSEYCSFSTGSANHVYCHYSGFMLDNRLDMALGSLL